MAAASSGAHSSGRYWRLLNDARRRYWLRRQRRCFDDEEAEHDTVGARGARRQDPTPSLPPKRFTHLLIGRPTPSTWHRRAEIDAGESVGGCEIGNLEPRHRVAPHIARKLMQRWYAPLSEVPIPLGPQRVLGARKVEGINDFAALPSVIGRRLRPSTRVRFVGNVTQPCTSRVGRVDVECQRAKPQTAPGDSSSETTRATLRARPRAISSSGFWSSSASIGLESHTGM